MPLAPLQPGDPRRIGDHRLVGRLGAGGMGVVFLAHAQDNSLVAVKQVRAELADDETFLARFRREASILTRVRGAFTANVLAVHAEDTPPYLVLEHVNGPSLAEHVARSGPLPPDTLRGFATALATAVLAMHREGVVHRDLKPANVLLAEDGPKVIDFGVAQLSESTRLTRTGIGVGSPGFMAPEQLTGTAGTPADVYAWALTVAFAGTGRQPFGTGTLETIHYRVLNTTPDMAGIPDDLTRLLIAATAKHPQARPTAEQLVAALTGQTVTLADHAARELVARTWLWTQLPAPPKRRTWPKVITAAAVALLLGATGNYLATRPTQLQSQQPTTATTTSPPTTNISTTTLPATQVLVYQPWAPEGLPSNVHASAVLQGTCIAPSSKVLRPEAFRCTVGNQIADPCFTSPFQSGVVACPQTPDRVTVIKVPDPLPPNFADAPDQPHPWLIELADGQLCNAAGGATTVVDGLRLNFHCPNGFIYGNPDATSPVWTVRYQANGSNAMETASVLLVYK